MRDGECSGGESGCDCLNGLAIPRTAVIQDQTVVDQLRSISVRQVVSAFAMVALVSWVGYTMLGRDGMDGFLYTFDCMTEPVQLVTALDLESIPFESGRFGFSRLLGEVLGGITGLILDVFLLSIFIGTCAVLLKNVVCVEKQGKQNEL